MLDSNDSAASDNSSSKGVGQVYALYVTSMLLVVTIGTAVQYASAVVGLGITELLLILSPAIIYLRIKRLPVLESLRLARVDAKTAAFGIAVGVFGYGAAVGLYFLSRPLIGAGPEFTGLNPTTLPGLFLLLFCGAVLAGVCEELLFRGVLQGTLERYGSWKAVLYTALLFAAFHINPWNFLPAFFLGAVFGLLVVKTGSTVPAILAHTSCNATSFTIAFVFRDQAETATIPIIVTLAIGFVFLFPLYLLRTDRSKFRPSLLQSVNSALPRRVGVVALSVALVTVLLVPATALAFVDVLVMGNDALEPDIRQGDHVIVVTPRLVDVSASVGDIVAFKDERKTYLRKVVRTEDGAVFVMDRDAERRLSPQQIFGKVIHKTRLKK